MKKIIKILSVIIMLLMDSRLYAMALPILPSEDSVWFAIKNGLYKYNKTQNEWSVFSSKNGLAGDKILDIGIDEGIIWVATNSGVSNSDVRFNDWRSFTSDKISYQNARCVAFSKDYVWIGTDKGVSRFDKLLEEWKNYVLSDQPEANIVNDIVIAGETAWFATSGGIFKLEIDYDKITQIDATLPSKNVIKAINVGDYIWFVTDSGIIRYDKKLISWKIYGTKDGIISYNINDIVVSGDKIWLTTQNGISVYDSISDSWSDGMIYHNMLPSRNVMSLAIDGDIIWFLTDKGVNLYDSKTGSWRNFNSSNALLDSSGQGIIVSGSVFVVTEKGVNIYDKKTQDWDNYKFPEKQTDASKAERGFRLDDKGVGFDVSKETQFRLAGVSSIELNNSTELLPDRKDEQKWDPQNDVNLRGTMPNRRSITGFYNDIKEDNIEYGLTYRGNDSDILFMGNGGKFRADLRNAELIDGLNLMGGGAHLRKKIGNTRLNLQPRYGKLIGNYDSNFFQYKIGTTIYQLENTDIVPDTEVVIAGMDTLQRGIDYIMVYPSGWLMFPQEELLEDGEYIEVQYQYKLKDEESNKNMAMMATTGAEIGENHYIGLDALLMDDFDVISLNSESKNAKVGAISMNIKPEIAYSRVVDDRSVDIDHLASKAEITATAPKTQLKLDYSKFGDDFYTFGMPKTRFGDLQQHISAFSQFDIFQWMPLKLYWQNDRSKQDFLSINENNAKFNIVISKPKYPTLALTGKGKWTNEVDDKNQTETSIRTELQYNLPNSLLSSMKIRKAEFDGYYYQADRDNVESSKAKTAYLKFNLTPIERFDLSASYKRNKTDDLKRFLLRSNFASVKGMILDLHYDDLSSTIKLTDGNIADINNTYLTTGINLIPGLWSNKLKMLTVLSRYSLLEQTIPISDQQYNDSKSRSLRVQTSLTPYSWVVCVGTYDGLKSWIDALNVIPKYDNRYRGEIEFSPNSKLRLLLEYDQEKENEGEVEKRSYLPSVLCETRLSKKWTVKLRNSYNKYSTYKNYDRMEAGSTLVPSLSFRYMNSDLSHGGRLYINQSFSISFDHSEQENNEFKSQTYATDFGMEWRLTRNFSSRLRASLAYKEARTIGESDEASAQIYVRLTARF
jgi:ligand-binding sensor domain-containing protein